MKVKYIGPDIGVDGLKNNRIYEVLYIDELCGYLAVVDESGEEYLYHPKFPQAIAGQYKGGKFEIVEDEKNTLETAIAG
jgi:hypothetical protein